MDADAAANPAASSSMSGVIGRSASYPNLQVMSPTGDPPFASNEAMAQHGENQLRMKIYNNEKGVLQEALEDQPIRLSKKEKFPLREQQRLQCGRAFRNEELCKFRKKEPQ